MDQYLAGVAPISTTMMVNQQLADVVGDSMLTGIEMNGTFTVVGLSDMTVGLLVPVTNYGEFVKTNAKLYRRRRRVHHSFVAQFTHGRFRTGRSGRRQNTPIVLPESEKRKNWQTLKNRLERHNNPVSGKNSTPHRPRKQWPHRYGGISTWRRCMTNSARWSWRRWKRPKRKCPRR